MAGHGWVRPNPDGLKARCGGPSICPVCRREQAALSADPGLELAAAAEAALAAFAPKPARVAHASDALLSQADELRERADELRAEADRMEARTAAITRLRGAVTAYRQQAGPRVVGTAASPRPPKPLKFAY